MSLRYIAHLADIHIGSGDRREEYLEVFDQLAERLKDFPYPSQLVVVIAGDVFHYKTKYSGEDVFLFNKLLDNLSRFPIIVIPGNHDANLNDSSRIDLITPLIQRPNVHYLRDTTEFELGGLKFYHVSVFDTSGREQLERLDLSGKILLYHGMVDGARFGKHIARDTRVSPAVLVKPILALLGDIHEQQFISATAAYAGSLIQQNLGESQDKGFILWDVEKRRGSPVLIPNRRGFIKIDLRGVPAAEVGSVLDRIRRPDEVLRVGLITDATDAEYEEQIRQVREKFTRVDKISVALQPAPVASLASPVPESVPEAPSGRLSPANTILETLEELLKDAGAAPEQIDEIIKMHKEHLAYNFRRWNIISAKWDNLYKYGSGNEVDFSRLGGVSGVVAPNRAGKSSIIDILAYGLFGEFLRGDKRSLINHGSRDSYLKIIFESNGERYCIERRDTCSRHSKVTLYRLTNDGDVNITGETVDATYRKMRELVGGLDGFLATGLYYDAQQDLVRIGKADRMKLLSRLYGLSDNEHLIKDIKAKIKELKATIAAVPTPKSDDPVALLRKLEKSRDEAIARIKEAKVELPAIRANIDRIQSMLANRKRLARLREEAEKARDERSKLAAELAQIRIEVEVPFAEPATGDKAALEKIAASRPGGPTAAELAAQIKSIQRTNPTRSRISKSPGELKKSIENLRAAIAADEEKLEQLRAALPPAPASELEAIERQIAALQAKIRPRTDQLVVQLRSEVDNLRKKTQLKFNPNCAECAANKSHLASDLVRAEQRLESAIQHRDTIARENAAAEEKLRPLKQERAAAIKYLSVSSEITKLEAAINEHKVNLKTAEAQLESAAELERLTSEHAKAVRAENAAAELNKIYLYEQYLLCKRRAELQQRIAALDEKLQAIEKELDSTDQDSADLEGTLKKLHTRNYNLGGEVNYLARMLETTKRDIEEARKDVAIKQNYDKTVPALTAKLSTYKLYAKVLEDDLRMAVIRKNMNRTLHMVNSILGSLTDFTISHDTSSGYVEFYIEEGNRIPLSMGSGFQRFISSVAFRLALTKSVAVAPEFIMIDEGFGCMDSGNLHRLADLFGFISQDYKFVFIISHLDELNTMLVRPLVIRSENGRAWINNTDPPAEHRQELRPQDQTNTQTPGKVTCECGAVVSRKSLYSHKKTSKHRTALAKVRGAAK